MILYAPYLLQEQVAHDDVTLSSRCWKESAQVAMKTAVNAKLDDELFWGRPNLPMVSGLPVIQADR